MRQLTSRLAGSSCSVTLSTSLDPVANAKVTALASAFQCRRPRLLRYILQWGLVHGQRWPIAGDRPPSPVQNISVRVTQGLRQEVQAAANAAQVPASAISLPRISR